MTTLSFLPTSVDLSIYKGDSVSLDVDLVNSDGSAYSFAGTPTFTANIETSSGSSSGSFTCTYSGNTVTMKATAATTGALTPGTTYYYDLQMVISSPATTRTWLKGQITVEADIT